MSATNKQIEALIASLMPVIKKTLAEALKGWKPKDAEEDGHESDKEEEAKPKKAKAKADPADKSKKDWEARMSKAFDKTKKDGDLYFNIATERVVENSNKTLTYYEIGKLKIAVPKKDDKGAAKAFAKAFEIDLDEYEVGKKADAKPKKESKSKKETKAEASDDEEEAKPKKAKAEASDDEEEEAKPKKESKPKKASEEAKAEASDDEEEEAKPKKESKPDKVFAHKDAGEYVGEDAGDLDEDDAKGLVLKACKQYVTEIRARKHKGEISDKVMSAFIETLVNDTDLNQVLDQEAVEETTASVLESLKDRMAAKEEEAKEPKKQTKSGATKDTKAKETEKTKAKAKAEAAVEEEAKAEKKPKAKAAEEEDEEQELCKSGYVDKDGWAMSDSGEVMGKHNKDKSKVEPLTDKDKAAIKKAGLAVSKTAKVDEGDDDGQVEELAGELDALKMMKDQNVSADDFKKYYALHLSDKSLKPSSADFVKKSGLAKELVDHITKNLNGLKDKYAKEVSILNSKHIKKTVQDKEEEVSDRDE
jgi:hypothetical protein